MTRLLIAFPALAVLGCAAPRATVIEEPAKKHPVAAENTQSTLPGPAIGLRDPDVLSDLPEDNGLRSPTAVTSNTPGGSPTVIARPPSEPSSDTAPPSGSN